MVEPGILLWDFGQIHCRRRRAKESANEAKQTSSRVRPYEGDVSIPCRHAGFWPAGREVDIVQKTPHSAARIGIEFNGVRADAGHDIAAARGNGRMRIDNSAAPVEFVEHRLKRGIAKPVALVT